MAKVLREQPPEADWAVFVALQEQKSPAAGPELREIGPISGECNQT